MKKNRLHSMIYKHYEIHETPFIKWKQYKKQKNSRAKLLFKFRNINSQYKTVLFSFEYATIDCNIICIKFEK